MAVITPTGNDDLPSSTMQYIWSGMTGSDTGLPVFAPNFADKTAHIYAATTFGSGTVIIQGTNDLRGDPTHPDHANANWVTLADAQGNAISKTSAAIETILDNVLWLRPSISGATAADVVVSIIGRKVR